MERIEKVSHNGETSAVKDLIIDKETRPEVDTVAVEMINDMEADNNTNHVDQ